VAVLVEESPQRFPLPVVEAVVVEQPSLRTSLEA
jgi:hypothetical protein